MRHWLGQTVEVLVEEKQKGRWRGRIPQNKLVFFNDPRELKGEVVQVHISPHRPLEYVGPGGGSVEWKRAENGRSR
jgi:tRNA-2-methylthio-N6-dimethylallyladenosine synthase